MGRRVRLAALGCGAAIGIAVVALVVRPRAEPSGPARLERVARAADLPDDEECGGPFGVRRAGAAELAVRNRAALAESARLQASALRRRAQAVAPALPATSWSASARRWAAS